jgi:hypothetical protein
MFFPQSSGRNRNADAGIQLHRPRNGRPSAVRERGPGSGTLPNQGPGRGKIWTALGGLDRDSNNPQPNRDNVGKSFV